MTVGMIAWVMDGHDGWDVVFHCPGGLALSAKIGDKDNPIKFNAYPNDMRGSPYLTVKTGRVVHYLEPESIVAVSLASPKKRKVNLEEEDFDG